MPVASHHSVNLLWGRAGPGRPMNFLYAGGGASKTGGDGYPALQLSRPRLKLQPRRLRCPMAGGAPADQHELAERPVRTHIFMDLVSSGAREPPPRRRSPSLIDRLCSSARQDNWRHRHRAEEHAAAAAAAAAAEERERQEQDVSRPPPVPPPPPGSSGTVRLDSVEELISLDQVDQDCFIVPFDMVDRFLPTGHKLPSTPPAQGQRLNLRQTASPGLGVVIHVLGHLTPLAPAGLQTAPARHVQLGACVSLMRQVSQTAGTRDALLLSNLERTEQFPFLLYYTVDKARRDVSEAYPAVVSATRATFSRLESTYVGEHNIKLYDEVASIARPPLSDQRRPVSDSTGYIISIFRVLEGDDRRNFERDWLSWTGARLLYRGIPACAGLRRMVLHKSCDKGDIYYILSCECSTLLDNVVASVRALPTLRARLVGYIGVYKLMAAS